MEHLNRLLKDGIKGLGANKTECAFTRLGKCIDKVDQVLNEDHRVKQPSGHQTIASVEMIIV